MSDTRDEAEQEMVSAGIASGMEDTLGSALSASFSMPPPQPRKKDSQSMMAAVAQAEKDTPAAQNEPSEPVPGMDEWKATYEGYLSAWQAESHEAREKAKATREAIEKEHADEAKAAADKVKADKREAEQKKKAKADQEKLQAELEGRKVGSTSKNTAAENEERERKVKEAWEMVKGADDGEETKEVVTDARGVTPRDLAAGQAVAEGQKRPKVAQTMYDPTTSTEPLPPSMQDSSSPSPTLPTDSVMQSRHSTTSQAWEEINRSSSSGSGEDLVEVSKPSSPQQSGSGANQQPPSHPPSLTLSVFSSPSTLSVSRVVAVLGINLVLPFINGVMLGFGEIFARQVVSAGRAWYWEGSNFIHKLVGRDTRDRSSGVSGVGLSGSRGFP